MSAKPDPESADEVLVNRALARQKGGATRLVAKYQGLVTSVLNRQVKDPEQAQDLAQETFLQAFRHLARLRDFNQFKSWLMRIAQRSFLAYRRSPTSQAQEKTVSTDLVPQEFAADKTGSDQLDRMVISQELRAVVEELPDPYRTTLLQRFYDDLPLAEIGERQGINLPLVKYRVRQGLKLLREKLQAHGMTPSDV